MERNTCRKTIPAGEEWFFYLKKKYKHLILAENFTMIDHCDATFVFIWLVRIVKVSGFQRVKVNKEASIYIELLL